MYVRDFTERIKNYALLFIKKLLIIVFFSFIIFNIYFKEKLTIYNNYIITIGKYIYYGIEFKISKNFKYS